MSMSAWSAAKDNLYKTERLLALVGRPQKTTAKNGVGTLHSLNVAVVIHHQERDGDKNYHDEKAFNSALSIVAKRRFSELRDEAIEYMKSEVARTGKDARQSVQSMLDQIDEYEKA